MLRLVLLLLLLLLAAEERRELLDEELAELRELLWVLAGTDWRLVCEAEEDWLLAAVPEERRAEEPL